MELSIYDIIKRPLVTTKSVELYKKLKQYTFEVHKAANKTRVSEAVEKLWDVKVDKVRILNVSGKAKIFNRKKFVSGDRKKAIITLKKGYKIEIPGMFETTATESRPVEKKSDSKVG